VLFALKAAIDAGESIAMKCDRLDFSSRVEPFQFLGRVRLFPITIYYLAVLFNRPVMFCIGVPGAAADGTDVFASPVFTPDPEAGRAANLKRAHEHFQAVLGQLETLLRQRPALWFNFLPLNPEAPGSPSIAAAACSSSPPINS
jgi:predicted LPLAT superfamily acyltransferase